MSASDDRGNDGYKPVTAADVTDLAGLPRRFDLFAAQVTTAIEVLSDKIATGVSNILDRLADMAVRQDRSERTLVEHTKQLREHEQRITALEQRATKRLRKK